MTPEQSAAFVFSQAASALIEAIGMMSENMQRQQNGHSIAYDLPAFLAVVTSYGIDSNTSYSYCTLTPR